MLVGAANPDKIELEKALSPLDGAVVVSRRGGGRHVSNNRLAEGVAAGQPSQPAPDAP